MVIPVRPLHSISISSNNNAHAVEAGASCCHCCQGNAGAHMGCWQTPAPRCICLGKLSLPLVVAHSVVQAAVIMRGDLSRVVQHHVCANARCQKVL